MALTEEQRLLVEAAPDVKILVTAGPGTGKTHVLIHRISSLICAADVTPGELLVLSFSRAAVKEIRDRLSKFGGSAGYVRVSTFDSFATRILATAEPSRAWQGENYDERVRHATRLIRTNIEARTEAMSYRHVIVDEVQDLIGDRADLVKALIEAGDQGFSLFGDPAQGIYNYQLKGEARRIGSTALYQWIREQFTPGLLERRLTFNFRVRSDGASVSLWAGPELNSPNPDYDNIRYRLETDLMGLPSVGGLSLAVPMLKSGGPSTAILCRDNGQAMTISGRLYDAGVKHRLQGRATDRLIARWIAVALRDLEGNLFGKKRFFGLMEQRTADDLPTPEEMWNRLKRIERLRNPNNLDFDMVNERLRSGDVPDELSESPAADVVVSTIHRAKGLEFERVLLVAPSPPGNDPIEVTEETRLLYVALTRPRSEIWHLSAPEKSFLWLREDLDRRWARGGPKKWMRTGLEVRGEDVHRDDPAGGFVIRESPIALQDYIRTAVKPGDPVVLMRRFAIVDGEDRAFYLIEHNGKPVGVTSTSFGGTLLSVLRINAGWEVKWPSRIEGLHVESIDTVAGLPTASRAAGLGGCGVWLRVRVYGLGRFVFEA